MVGTSSTMKSERRSRIVFLLLLMAADETLLFNPTNAFSSNGSAENGSPSVAGAGAKEHPRPLLHNFARGIGRRIRHSNEGTNRSGQVGAYTSEETISCLEMQGSGDSFDAERSNISSRKSIREAFTESSRIKYSENSNDKPHGRSSGSGCTIIRLTGADAASIHGLTQYTNRFFERVDNDDCNDDIKATGVFRIDNHVYAGFDDDVNGEGKMQFLDTRILPNRNDIVPLLLPLEVGDLVGSKSLSDAHKGMDVLLDIGSQITSAVLDMDSTSAEKLIDDGTHVQQQTGCNKDKSESGDMVAGNVSNSYHRLIRYLKPQQSSDGMAFQAHVDSSFLTLIPMPELPGLEVWCPSSAYNARINEESKESKGEWVTIPALDRMRKQDGSNTYAYVVAMAGEFLQLTSNGQVPVCIHRVIPPKTPVLSHNGLDGKRHGKYKPRVSAPMFLRPRRGEGARLDVGKDLKQVESSAEAGPSASESNLSEGALYFEKGLLDECDSMHLWSAHEVMMRK